jgi:hypothetical protein
MEGLQKLIETLSSDLKTGLSLMENKLASSLMSVETKLEITQALADATTNSILTLNTWKSGIDTQVFDLSSSVQALRKQVDRMVVGVGLNALGTTPPNITLGVAPPPTAPATAITEATLHVINSGQAGHGVSSDTRGQTVGNVTFPLSTQSQVPAVHLTLWIWFRLLHRPPLITLLFVAQHLNHHLRIFLVLLVKTRSSGKNLQKSISVCSQ